MVASLDGDNLVVHYYLGASEIWPDQRGGVWWERPYKSVTTVSIKYIYVFDNALLADTN
jgi:hypothetical protein